jgi:hypothetical protein
LLNKLFFRHKNRSAGGQGGTAGPLGEWACAPEEGTGPEVGQQNQGRQVLGVLCPHAEGAQTGMYSLGAPEEGAGPEVG